MINYIDVRFIINLSISITISLFIIFILGKAVSDTISEMVKFLLKIIGFSFLKKIFPVKFYIGFPLDRISPDKFTYEKHKVVNFGKLNQTFLPSTGIDLFLKVESKLPFLYEGSIIRIQIVDFKEQLGIYSGQKLPSKPTTFVLAEMMYENNIVCHIHVDFKPVKTFDNYDLPINIFFQGKLYKENILLTVKSE